MDCARELFKETITYIGPARTSVGLINQADSRDSVMYFSPSRFKYENLKILRNRNGWDQRVHENIISFDFSSSFDKEFRGRVGEIKYELMPIEPTPESLEENAKLFATTIVNENPSFIIYHINKKARWVSFQYLVKELSNLGFDQFDTVYAIVTNSPTMLDKKMSVNSDFDGESPLKSIHYIISYSGLGIDSGYPFRPDLVAKMLADGSIFDSDGGKGLTIGLRVFKNYVDTTLYNEKLCGL